MGDELVLVTGASGYLATHVVKTLQDAGYRVRGTVRSLANEQKIKHLYELSPGAKHKLELVEADLNDANSWKQAVSGCTYVHHVASPFQMADPKHEDDLVKPAVAGTVSVLEACKAAGTVRRVVLTSSIMAVSNVGGNTIPFTESHWPDPNESGCSFYARSKMYAEKAAWDFVQGLSENEKFELAVVNPSVIAGPPLHRTACESTDSVKQLMMRDITGVPKFITPVIDVRDVAQAHLQCMTVPEAAGNRHIIFAESIWYYDLAKLLDKEFRPQGYNIPTTILPNVVTSVLAWFDKELNAVKKYVSQEKRYDTTRMKTVLGIIPRPIETTYIDMAYSMIDNGFVPKKPGYRPRI